MASPVNSAAANPAPMDILDEVRRLRSELKRSEGQIADLVLSDPRRVLDLNVDGKVPPHFKR